MRLTSLLTLFTILTFASSAQDFSNKGTDFWVGYGYHVRYVTTGTCGGTNCQDLVLYFAADVNTNVKVEVPAVGYVANYVVPAGQNVESAPIPKSGGQDCRLTSGGVFNTGIHITSDNPIVAYAHNYSGNVSGATILFPTNTLGKEYYSLSYKQYSNEGSSNCFFFIIATEPGVTSVDITPSGATTTIPGGTTTTVSLTQGQIYNVMGTVNGNTGVDLSGSYIKSRPGSDGSCKKIAVFSGSGKINLGCPIGNGTGDNLLAQCFPKAAWGQKYLTAPTKNLPRNYFRVLVSDDAAVVKVNGSVISGLVNHYYDLALSSIPNLIEADKPIMVAQYITSAGQCGNSNPSDATWGDPEMIYLSPIEQTIDKVIIKATSHALIDESFINVIIKSTAVNTVRVDGALVSAMFVTHPADPAYSYAQIPASVGLNVQHTVTANEGFNVIAYGYGNYESWGYNGGTNIKDLTNFVGSLDTLNVVSHNNKCVNDPVKYMVTLSYPPSQIVQLDWHLQPYQTNPAPIINPVPDSTFFINGKQVWRYTLTGNYYFTTPGNYPDTCYVTTSLTDDCGSTISIPGVVTVVPSPVASYTLTPTSGCEPVTVQFSDNSTAVGSVITIWNWDFNDGSNAIGQTILPHVFPARATPYNVKLQVITDVGCVKDTIRQVSVYPVPDVTISGPPEICNYTPVTFTNSTIIYYGGFGVSWAWDFGDGTPVFTSSNSNNVVHTYITPGNYIVSLTVITNNACSKTVTTNITVNEKPATDFVLPGVCLSDAFAVFNNATTISSGALTYNWNFGDPGSGGLNFSTLANPQHSYSSVGYYTVTLTAHGPKCDSTISKVLTVNGAVPKADFNIVSTIKLCSNVPVQIQNTSTVDFGGLTRVEIYWDNVGAPAIFDIDNAPLPNKIYSHLYGSFQTPISKVFTIRYKVYSGGICIDEITKNVTIYASPLVKFDPIPDICLSAAPYQILEASQVGSLPSGVGFFSGTGITDPIYGIFNPALAGPGTWPITYTFTAFVGGCFMDTIQTITVLPPPVAKFIYNAPACEAKAVIFTDQSTPGAGNIVEWTWDFGDGTVPIVRTDNLPFTHTFANWSTTAYHVTLRVKTNGGCYSSYTFKDIFVNPVPKADFTFNEPCLPAAIGQFYSTPSTISSGTIVSWAWEFGDLSSGSANYSSLQNPSHIFNTVGPYDVHLYVISDSGCVGDTIKPFDKIHPQPIADFIPSKTEICEQTELTLTDNSSGVDAILTNWLWDFGDGYTISATNGNPVSHTYTHWGYPYYVTLNVINSRGCSKTSNPFPIIVDSFPFVHFNPSYVELLEGENRILYPETHDPNLTYLWTPFIHMNDNTVKNPIIRAIDDVTYTLTVTTFGGCEASDRITIKVMKPPVIPNTFTPNNDRTNDTWKIKYLADYKDCRVQVFNRYGQLVFESHGYSKEWDGTYNGKALPWGTYYYIIEMSPWRGPITGYVTIIK